MLDESLKIVMIARHQWLTPVILPTWEAEIGRAEVRGQANSWEWWYVPVILSYLGGRDQEDLSSVSTRARKFVRSHLLVDIGSHELSAQAGVKPRDLHDLCLLSG
jgi:hypothetical protein